MILDTNALSAFAEGERSAMTHIDAARRVAIPVVVLGEYRFGILGSRRQTVYTDWLNGVIPDCEILPIDDQTATEYAFIRRELAAAGKPIPVNDLWIAALCRQHDLPLMTLDTHFDAVKGLRLIRW